MTLALKLFSPFKKLTPAEERWSVLGIIVIIFTAWMMSGNTYIPKPMEIVRSFPRLMEKDIFRNFGHSIGFCFTAIFYSFTIALVICYLSVLPFFRTFAGFLRRFRFLPSTGLSFLFMKITVDIQQQMLWMMVWGISTWLIYSLVGIALSITDKEIEYARSLRLNRWQVMREVLIKGKAADIFQAVIANFAIAWMMLATIENLSKGTGGIGVVLAESNKYYKFGEVYAIQILILFSGIGIDVSLRKIKDWIFPHAKE